ncbi:MAG: tetratricopeptide repeat protein, partial [candidate division WOR-3 bacterium]
MKRMILVLGIVIVVLFFSACGRKGDVKGATEAIKKGKYSEAIKSLKYALTNDSLNPEIHFNLCLAYCYLDSADKAYPHFLKIVELNSPLKDSMELKLLLTKFLKMDPYSSSPIPMGKMNQFK